MKRTLVIAGVLVWLLAACGGGGGKKTTAETAATSAPTTSSPAASSTTVAPAGSTTPVSIAVTHPTAHLVAVRAARQTGSDRVVFEFEEQVPGYRVAYATSPVMNTAGKEVTVAGTAKLVVRMEQAGGVDLSGANPQTTYDGPSRITPQGTAQVQELARVEDFEAVLSWVLGVRTTTPFRVTTLASPPRLVIDVSG